MSEPIPSAPVVTPCPSSFVGRDGALQDVLSWLHSVSSPSVLWVGGSPGAGKTTFMGELARRLGEDPQVSLVTHFFCQGDSACQVDGFFVRVVGLVAEALGLDLPPATEPDFVRLMALLQGMRGRSAPGEAPLSPRRLVFLLDGVDEVGSDAAAFARRLVQLCRVGEAVWICAGTSDPSWREFVIRARGEVLWPRGDLPPLDDSALRDMVPASLPEDFVTTLVDRCDGSPLYVRTVLDRLREGQDLEPPPELPRGWRRLARSLVDECLAACRHEEGPQILAVLLAAGQPLGLRALREIVAQGNGAGTAVQVDRALRHLAPLVASPRPETYALAHGWLHRALGESETVAAVLPEMRERLLDWCAGWHARPASECPRHHARLLWEVGQVEALERLARDRCLRQMLSQAHPDVATGALEPLRLALRPTAMRKDVAATARLLVEHADAVGGELRPSPLEVLRAGNLGQARRMCESLPAEIRTVWLLVLAWELEDEGRRDEAAEFLGELLRESVKVGGWQGTYAALVLERIRTLVADVACDLPGEILDEPSAVLLAENLSRAGDFEAALRCGRALGPAPARAAALRHAGVAMLRAGKDVLALGVLSEAASGLEEGRGNRADRVRELCAIATAEGGCLIGRGQAAQHLRAAATLASQVDDETERWSLLRDVASSQARGGDPRAAEKTLEAIPREEDREIALFELARLQIAVRDIEGAACSVALISDASCLREPAFGLIEDARLASEVGSHLAASELDEALVLAWRITRVEDRVRGLRAIAHGQARSGLPRAAFGAAREAAHEADYDPRSAALYDVAESMARSGDVGAALEILREIAGDGARVAALCRLAVELRQSGDGAGASACTADAVACARECIDEAERARILCRAAVAASADGWHVPRVSTLLGEALVSARGLMHDEERNPALREVSLARAATGDLPGALETAWVVADRPMRAEAFRCLAETPDADGRVARSALAAGLDSLGDSRRDLFRAQALGEIVDTQLQLGDVGGALRTADAIPISEHRVTALLRVAATKARLGDHGAAPAWRAAFRAVFAIPDDRMRPEALRQVLLAQAEVGEYAAALGRTEELEDAWQRERLHVEITQKKALWWAGHGDMAAAFEAAGSIGEMRERLEVEREIARCQAEAGQLEEALVVWRRGVADARSLEPLQSLPLVRAVALAVAACGATDEARGMLVTAVKEARAMPQAWDRARTLHALCLAQVEIGELESAQRTAHLIRDDHQRTSALREIAEAMASLARYDEALKLVAAFQDEHERKVELRRIAKAQAKDGLAEAALLTVERIGSGSEQDDARVGVAIETARRGAFQEAEDMVAAIAGAWYRATALREVAAARVRAHDQSGGREVFTRAVAAARHAWPDKRAAALRDIAVAIAEAGVSEEAASLLAEAVAALSGITDRRARVDEVRALVSACLAVGTFDLAEEVVRLADGAERSSLTGKVAVALALAGHGERAVELVDTVVHKREAHLVAVAGALVETRDEGALLLLVPMASHYAVSACRVAALLARLHPELAGAVARALA